MSDLLAHRQHYVEAQFPHKDSARKFAFTMIEAGFSAYAKDIEPTEQESETDTRESAKKYLVQIPFTSSEILSPKNTELILSAARNAGGKCVGVKSLSSYSYYKVDSDAAAHIASGIFDDKPEN